MKAETIGEAICDVVKEINERIDKKNAIIKELEEVIKLKEEENVILEEKILTLTR